MKMVILIGLVVGFVVGLVVGAYNLYKDRKAYDNYIVESYKAIQERLAIQETLDSLKKKDD